VGALALGSLGANPGDEPGGRTDGSHWIVCANLVKVYDIPELSQKLNAIRGMSNDEIKANYKRQLLDDDHAEKNQASKGAGLGFLTIARDSRTPIEFSFVSDPSTSCEHAYFFVKAII
jgi:hypothetical protein